MLLVAFKLDMGQSACAYGENKKNQVEYRLEYLHKQEWEVFIC